jgi:hypothetical protein
MSSKLNEPLDPIEAKRLIRQLLETGEFHFSRHAETEMAADHLTTVDCVNVLRGGVVEPPEWENGSWRYRVCTGHMCVVIAFRSAMALVVVTAWRIT